MTDTRYIFLRNRKCELCEYYHVMPHDEPCKSCKQRVNPKEPAKRLVINDAKYVLEKETEEECKND